jgi:uncharacterized protein YdeI (YjbR/CyaY-like superfamily)
LETLEGLPIQLAESKDDWLQWLESNHKSTEGVCIKLAKTGSGMQTVSYEDAVNAASVLESLSRANLHAFLYRIKTAAKPQTRSARIEKFIGMLEAGQVFHP